MIRLTDEQWERIRDHFPEEHIPDGRPGRKPIPTRRVLEAVLWILNTGAQWHMLPQSYPNYKTVHRRFQTWCSNEVLRRVLTDVANELRDKGALDEEECFIDATFVMAKGGGAEIGATKRGKGLKIMAIVDRHGLPLSVSTHAANHHEVRLVQLCFDFYMIEAKPKNLIGDRAYDSDPLDESSECGIPSAPGCGAAIGSRRKSARRASVACSGLTVGDLGSAACCDWRGAGQSSQCRRTAVPHAHGERTASFFEAVRPSQYHDGAGARVCHSSTQHEFWQRC
jgi:transposase